MTDITIFTDGACSGNPGPGGYGVVILANGQRQELSQGYLKTTNNRMEMMAAIQALESLNVAGQITLHTDSRYLIDAVEKGWAKKWRAKGWMRNKRDKALNPDLWDRLLTLLEARPVSWNWVRGHTGNRENERCDRLAVAASRAANRIPDEGFDNPRHPGPRAPKLF
jgi:ribonuclease HI